MSVITISWLIFVAQTPVTAQAFDPAPSSFPLDEGELVTVNLADLIDQGAGGYLQGLHFFTTNCCKHYTCSSGGGACGLSDPTDPNYAQAYADRVCADANASGSIESHVLTQIPWSLVEPNAAGARWVRTVLCSELPRLTSSSDWSANPVDGASSQADEDAFVEAQVYYHAWSYFSWLRGLANDPSFCFADSSMRCDGTGAPILGVDGRPERTFHLRTNGLMPGFDLADMRQQARPIAEGGQGRGAAGDPVRVDSYMRTGGADFMPAHTPAAGLPPGLSMVLAYDHDSIAFMQGTRDWGYDGDIVYRALGQALVHTFLPQLRTHGIDSDGSHAYPGALANALSDYLAAAYTLDSQVGEYASSVSGPHDVNNTASCPLAIVGEASHDSLVLSGALWEIRAQLTSPLAFDALIVASLEGLASTVTPTFTLQGAAESWLLAMQTNASFSQLEALAARAVFEARGVIGCERIVAAAFDNITLTRLEQPGPAALGVSSSVPSLVQIHLTSDEPVESYTLTWMQRRRVSGPFLPQEPQPVLGILAHTDRIVWEVVDEDATRRARATTQDGDDITSAVLLANNEAEDNNGNVMASVTVEVNLPDAPPPMFVSLINSGDELTITNLSISKTAYVPPSPHEENPIHEPTDEEQPDEPTAEEEPIGSMDHDEPGSHEPGDTDSGKDRAPGVAASRCGCAGADVNAGLLWIVLALIRRYQRVRR